ncbi:UNVERIFIED_CONTAM: hypothetical protein Sindi_1773700 [Sesamum indicum]
MSATLLLDQRSDLLRFKPRYFFRPPITFSIMSSNSESSSFSSSDSSSSGSSNSLSAISHMPLAHKKQVGSSPKILARLEIGQMQIAPNSIRHILAFIIVMSHLGFEPDFDNFCSLTTSKRSGDQGLDDDLIGNLTRYQYKANLLLTENILKLAGLSPTPIQTQGSLAFIVMDARIRAKKAKQVTTPPRSDYPLPPSVPNDTPRSLRGRSSSPHNTSPLRSSARIAIPLVITPWLKGLEESDPEPLVRRKSKGKEIAAAPSKRRRESTGPSPEPSQKKTRVVASAVEEAEGVRVADELTTWWKEAQVELQLPSYRLAVLEGEKITPN